MKSLLSQTVLCLAALLCVAPHALAQGDAEKHFRRGHERLDARDLDGALAETDRAIALKPDYAEAYEQRSTLRMLKGNVEGAFADLDKAVAHAPEVARLYAARGRLRMMRNDPGGALADFDSAIARGHRSDEVYTSRGHVKMMLQQDAASAVDDFTTAITLNPRRIGNYLGRSSARSQTGDEAGALVDLNYIIEQHEQREKERAAAGRAPEQAPDAHLKSPAIAGPTMPAPPAAQGAREAGNKEPGGKDKTERKIMTQTVVTVNTGPGGAGGMEHFEYMHNVAAAYLNRGGLHSRQGNKEAAIRDFDKALEINPRESRFYFMRALAHRDLGRLEDALADFTRAAELEPPFPFFHVERGVTLLLLKRDAEAEKSFAEGLKLDPKLQQSVDTRRAETIKKREQPRQ